MSVLTIEIIKTVEIALPRIQRNHESIGIQVEELYALLCVIGIYSLTGWRSDINREEFIADFIAAKGVKEEELQVARDRYEQYRYGADTATIPRTLITAMVRAYTSVPRQQVLDEMKQMGERAFNKGAKGNRSSGLTLREMLKGTKANAEGNFGNHPADE